MRKTIYSIVMTFLIVGCSKEQNTVPLEHLKIVGEYSWSWTDNSAGNTYSENTVESYGLKIQKNQKVIFYKESQRIEKTKIYSYDIDHNTAITTIDLYNSGRMYFFEKELTVSNFPFEGSSNFFYKQ